MTTLFSTLGEWHIFGCACLKRKWKIQLRQSTALIFIECQGPKWSTLLIQQNLNEIVRIVLNSVRRARTTSKQSFLFHMTNLIDYAVHVMFVETKCYQKCTYFFLFLVGDWILQTLFEASKIVSSVLVLLLLLCHAKNKFGHQQMFLATKTLFFSTKFFAISSYFRIFVRSRWTVLGPPIYKKKSKFLFSLTSPECPNHIDPCPMGVWTCMVEYQLLYVFLLNFILVPFTLAIGPTLKKPKF